MDVYICTPTPSSRHSLNPGSFSPYLDLKFSSWIQTFYPKQFFSYRFRSKTHWTENMENDTSSL